MTTFVHRSIVFAPYATNVLDCVGREDLFTPSGHRVTVSRLGTGFQIQIAGNNPYYTEDNLSASYYLNSHEVGVHEKCPTLPPSIHRDRAARLRTLTGAIETARQMATSARKIDQQDGSDDAELAEIERLLHETLLEAKGALDRATAAADIEKDVERALRKAGQL